MTYARLDKAIQWATRLHAGEERDGPNPLPYSTHPIEVMVALRRVGHVVDEDMLCAAALHDTIEDGVSSFGAIDKAFGPRVRNLVKELTRREPTTEQTKGLTKEQIWEMRAWMLLEEIGAMSPDAQAIKLADRLINVRDAQRSKTGYKLERYLWQSREIRRIIPRQVNPGLWDALDAELLTEALHSPKAR